MIVEKISPPCKDSYYKESSLSKKELDVIRLIGADYVAYTYLTGDSDGNGELLYRAKKLWAIVDIGHCSCFGPLHDYSLIGETWYRGLEDLRTASSEDALYVRGPLIAAAMAREAVEAEEYAVAAAECERRWAERGLDGTGFSCCTMLG